MAQAMTTSGSAEFALPQEGGFAYPAEPPGRPIALVLGLPGSGLGLCSRVLRLLGADLPETQADDPLGAVHDSILALFERPFETPYHDLQLPAGWWADPRLRPLQRDLAALLHERLADAGTIGLQDPRIARLLPLWHPILRQAGLAAKIVLCLRNPARFAGRGGLDPAVGEYRWFVYVCDVFRQLRDSPVAVVEFETWFTEPERNSSRLARLLGLDPQPAGDLRDALADIVDPALRHDPGAATEARHPLVRSFYRLVRGLADDPAAREPVDYIVDQFVTFRQLHRPFERQFELLARASNAEAANGEKQELRQLLAERTEQLQKATVQRLEADAALARARQGAELRLAAAEAALHAEIAARDGRVAELSRQIEAATAGVERAVAEQAGEAAALRQQLAAREAEAQQFAARGEGLAGELQGALAQVAALREALAAHQAEAQQAAARIDELARQVQAAQSAGEALHERLAARESEVQQARSQRAEADAALSWAQQHAALRDAAAQAAAEEAALLRDQFAAVEAQLAAANAQIEAAAAQRQVAQGETEELRARLARMAADAEAAAAEHSRLLAVAQAETAARQQGAQGEIEIARAQLAKAMADAEAAAAEHGRLLAATQAEAAARQQAEQGEIEQLHAQLAQATANAEAAAAEHGRLLAATQAEAAALRETLAAAGGGAEAAGLRGWLAAAHQEIGTLRQELAAARAATPEPQSDTVGFAPAREPALASG